MISAGSTELCRRLSHGLLLRPLGTRSMKKLADWMSRLPWILAVAGSLTLGLAPFKPQPHLFEKLGMLVDGTLTRPIDIFDLCLHGVFPLLLVLKVAFSLLYPTVSRDGKP